MDFDDLLLRTAERIENGQVQEGWEKPFRYLLVDEFQDINPVQYRLVKLWSARGRELFVIGDPDQSIYGFRGADSACFAHLGEEYPGLEKIRLLENYRSSPQILKVAQTLIRRDLKTGLRRIARRMYRYGWCMEVHLLRRGFLLQKRLAEWPAGLEC